MNDGNLSGMEPTNIRSHISRESLINNVF